MKINNFGGDLTDNSAKKEALAMIQHDTRPLDPHKVEKDGDMT